MIPASFTDLELFEITVYRNSGPGSIDVPVTEATGIEPTDPRAIVAALERWARENGITDYSVDQDGYRVFLCPAHSAWRWYAYLPIPARSNEPRGGEAARD